MKHFIYNEIAQRLQAMQNCEKSGNTEWFQKHKDVIHKIEKNYLPAGSGFDSGTELDFEQSTPEELIFNTGFHHMDTHGGYDGWTHHKVVVRASLVFGVYIFVGGGDRNGIKDYIHEVFSGLALTEVGSILL